MKNHKSINDIDLLLNDIDELEESDKIELYENGRKYIFSHNDMTHIFDTSLGECCDGWPLPKTPKNPYTNLDFSKEQLKKITREIKNKSLLVALYMEYDYNIDMMKSFHLNYFKKRALDEEFKEIDSTEIDTTIDIIVKRFTDYELNRDSLETSRHLFIPMVKDFNLMTSCDSKYLKNYLYKKIQGETNQLFLEHTYLNKMLTVRKIFRVKRLKN